MAVTRGCNGRVKAKVVGASGAAAAVGELTDWSFDEASERLDASAMGTCTKKFEAGAKETTGQITVHWDGADTVQNLITPGAALFIEIYPQGTGSSKKYYKTPTAGATITNVNRSGNGVDGIVGASYSFAVNGSMTATST